MTVVESFPRQVREIENVWIPLSDGCRLAARIWLPDDAEAAPVPAILEYLPYRKRDFMRARDEPMHHYFAGHGYACLILVFATSNCNMYSISLPSTNFRDFTSVLN